MFTTHEDGVTISKDAMNLAYAAGQAVKRLLVDAACRSVKNGGGGVVDCPNIEEAARNVTLALDSLVSSLRAGTHGSEDTERAA